MNEFSGEDIECLFKEWLPSIELASLWNALSEKEKMIWLAFHLKGRSLQEWKLLQSNKCATFAWVTEVLCSRLDSMNKAVAAQFFRRRAQHEI